MRSFQEEENKSEELAEDGQKQKGKGGRVQAGRGRLALRTSRLSLKRFRGEAAGRGETHTAETQVIPQLKGLWV